MHHRHWLVLHHWSKRANLTARHGRRALRLGLIPALTVTMTASIRCAHVTAAIATLLQGLVGAGEGRGLPAAAVDAVTGEVGQCLAANSRIGAVDEAEDVARLGLVACVLSALRIACKSAWMAGVTTDAHVRHGGVMALLCVIRRWAWDHALRTVLGQDGACEIIFLVLGEYLALAAIDTWRTRVAEVSEIALGALHALAWNPVNKLRLAEVPRGLELVVNAMQHFRSAAQLQTQGIAFFSIMSYGSDPNKALLSRHGAISVLVKAMHAHKDLAHLQQPACLAIWSLATESFTKHDASSAEQHQQVHPSPQQRAKAGPRASPKVKAPTQQLQAGNMQAGAQTEHEAEAQKRKADERKAALATEGAIEALLSALHAHCNNALLCERAARALGNLAFSNRARSRRIYNGKDVQTSMYTGEGLEIFTEAFRVHRHHPNVLSQVAAVVKNVCSALHSEADDRKRNLPRMLPCVQALAEAMERHPCHSELLKQGAAALGNAALNNGVNAALPTSVVDVLLDGMQRLRLDDDVQKRGMIALSNLASTQGDGPAARALRPPQRNLYSTRLFAEVVNVLEVHGHSRDLVKLALRNLERFADSAGKQAAAAQLAPPVTTRFWQRLARNSLQGAEQSEWGDATAAIKALWNALAKKGFVRPPIHLG